MSKRNNRKFTLDLPEKNPVTTPPVKLNWFHILLISFAICLVFLISLFTTGEYLWGSGTDIHTYQFPHRDFAFSALREGHWPLWNPYIFSGVPFQTGVHPLAYPLTILGLIFSTGWEIKITVLLHLTIALAFTIYFLRLFNIKAVPAFFGGICFALGGFFFSHLYAGHIDIVISAAYLPVMMYFFERCLRSRTLKWTLIAGLLMALTLLTGHYQIIYLTILLMGFSTMLRTLLGSNLQIFPLTAKAVEKEQPVWRQPAEKVDDRGDKEAVYLLADNIPFKTRLLEALYGLERLVIIGLISGLLTLFQLLPMLESSAMANRSVVRDLEFATSFGVPPLNWLTYLAPDIFGGTKDMPFFAQWSGWEGQGYFGIIALLLVIVAIGILPLKKQLPLVLLLLFVSFLAMGQHTPVFKWYFFLDPMIGRFRAQSRFVMLAAFLGSWLSALTLHELLTMSQLRLRQCRKALYIILGTVLVVFAAFILLLAANSHNDVGLGFVGQIVAPRLLRGIQNGANSFLLFMNSQLLFSGLLLLVATGTLILGTFYPEKRRYLVWLLLLVTTADLFFYAQPKLTTAPAEKFGFNHKVVNYLQGKNKTYQRLMTAPGLRGVNNGEAHGLAHDGGYDTLIEARYNQFANLAMGYPKDRQLMLMTLFNYGPFWQTQSVAWFLSDHPLEMYPDRTRQAFAPFRLDTQIDNYYIYYNPDVLPRAFATHKVQEYKDAVALYRQLTKTRLTPEQVFWTAEDGDKLPAELAQLPAAAGTDKVTIKDLSLNNVTIEADMAASGLVIMTDTPFPGWRATVDGRETTLYSINGGLHRAILTPAGHHTIYLYYWPARLTIGLTVSIIALLLAVAYLLLLHYRKVPKFIIPAQQ